MLFNFIMFFVSWIIIGGGFFLAAMSLRSILEPQNFDTVVDAMKDMKPIDEPIDHYVYWGEPLAAWGNPADEVIEVRIPILISVPNGDTIAHKKITVSEHFKGDALFHVIGGYYEPSEKWFHHNHIYPIPEGVRLFKHLDEKTK